MKERLMQWMNHLGMTASRFADEIGVQRSGISHILSGRNQPGYDFLVKTLEKFPDLNSEWLLIGKGNMLKNSGIDKDEREKPIEKARETPSEKTAIQVTNVNSIKQVMILYHNGTFEQFNPAKKD